MDRWEESERASEAEVSGQLRRMMEGENEPSTSHEFFKGQTALAAHGRQRHRQQHSNLT